MSYDPDERRDTPLARKLKERILRGGPITVTQYMQACLQDPEHGYYVTRDAIGAQGDFITAPEISQVFGELIGLWCAVVWQQMGRPDPMHLIELGPGRGTMMRDMLRALGAAPEFLRAARVHILERSETLAKLQQRTMSGARVPGAWWTHPRDVPQAPSIVVANEFLDTYSVAHQLVRTPSGWATRGVGLDDKDRLLFVALGDRRDDDVPAALRDAPDGSIFEIGDQVAAEELCYFAREAMAALFIDYGHTAPAIGETLQAVRYHRPEHPLCSPGEADLTAHVDFARFAADAVRKGLLTDGPVTQSEFLGSLGVMERASRLMAANPAKAAEIEAGVARLMSPSGMGSRFKAIGIRSPSLPPLPGFASPANSG